MILLTGGKGLLGTHVLERLLAKKYPVRVIARGATDWQDTSLSQFKQLGAEVVLKDLQDEQDLDPVMSGCNAIVNLAGIMRETPEATFDGVHVRAVKNLVDAALRHNILRFVHVSCLGASQHSDNLYFRSKWEGENIVRNSRFYWTIFRPSFMFGSRCQLLALLKPIIEFSPFLLVPGSALNKLQLVFVEDVADCIVQSIFSKETAQRSYDLAGPTCHTLSELMQHAASGLGLSKPALHVPSEYMLRAIDLIAKVFSKMPIRSQDLAIAMADSVADFKIMTENFQVKGVSVDEKMNYLIARA